MIVRKSSQFICYLLRPYSRVVRSGAIDSTEKKYDDVNKCKHIKSFQFRHERITGFGGMWDCRGFKLNDSVGRLISCFKTWPTLRRAPRIVDLQKDFSSECASSLHSLLLQNLLHRLVLLLHLEADPLALVIDPVYQVVVLVQLRVEALGQTLQPGEGAGYSQATIN
jgi:hypothetical protein